MTEKWQEGVDKDDAFEVLLYDLPKTFACLPHEVLIAKLHAYGFDIKSLNPIYNYMSNIKQRSKISGAYSSR